MRPAALFGRIALGIAAVCVLLLPLAGTASAESTPGDGQIPGIARALPLTIDDTLNITDDVEDVSRIYLRAGQMLGVAMVGSEGTDFTVALLSKDATSVSDTTHFVAISATEDTSTESFLFEAPTTGYYYLDVYMHTTSGDGNYFLQAGIVTQRISALSGPSKVRPRKYFTVSGWVTPKHAPNKGIVAACAYHLERGRWKKRTSVATARLRDGGSRSVFSFRAKLSAGKWRIRASHNVGTRTIYTRWKYVAVR